MRAFGRVRTIAAAVLAPAAATMLALPLSGGRESAASIYMLGVVVAAAVGGLLAGLGASVLAFLGLIYYFTPPRVTLPNEPPLSGSSSDLVGQLEFLLLVLLVVLSGVVALAVVGLWELFTLAAYFLVAAETYLATHAGGVFRLAFAGVGPTELRIVLAVGAFYVVRHPWIDFAGRHLLLDVSAAFATMGLVLVFVLSAVRTTRDLYRAEPLPRSDGRAA